MTSVKYTRIPMADPMEQEATSAFDFSSPFSYEERGSRNWKYRSAFTYDNTNLSVEHEKKESQFATDNVARLLVLFGFCVVYIVTFPVLVWFSFKKVKENERFVVFRLGHCRGSKGPGLVFILPILDRYHKIDVHLKLFSVPPKQVITSDGAIIEVGAEIYHQVQDAEKSVKNVQDLNRSTRVLVQTALCNILSQKTLAEIEAERKSIADTLMETSNKTCSTWGVEIQRTELSQIKVLSDPPPKSAPTLMMPPGLMGAGAGMGMGDNSGLPSVFMQLANAVMSSQSEDQGQAISDALAAFHNNKSNTDTNIKDPNNPNNNNNIVTVKEAQEAPQPLPPSTASGYTPIGSDRLLSLIGMSLDQSLVLKVGASYQFDIQGEDGGLFYLDLRHDSGSIARGTLPSSDPDVVVSTTMEDLQTMLAGDLSPFHAYMSGRLKLSGDVRVAMRLEDLADRLKPVLSGTC